MPDEFDRASALEQTERAACVAAQRARPGMKAGGLCHWCAEPVAPGLLFCDAGCRDDYETAKRMRVIRGSA